MTYCQCEDASGKTIDTDFQFQFSWVDINLQQHAKVENRSRTTKLVNGQGKSTVDLGAPDNSHPPTNYEHQNVYPYAHPVPRPNVAKTRLNSRVVVIRCSHGQSTLGELDSGGCPRQ
jgi:hypothetical protein